MRIGLFFLRDDQVFARYPRRSFTKDGGLQNDKEVKYMGLFRFIWNIMTITGYTTDDDINSFDGGSASDDD